MVRLLTKHDTANSFYGKAKVDNISNTNTLVLYSYDIQVACIEYGKLTIYHIDSNTTWRHIKEFMIQNGFLNITRKYALEMYGVKKEEEEVW